jgi:beta-lactamase regulating signal transducer with metallopeptidase domain
MTVLARLAENPLLVIGGWTLLLVIWESALLAVLFEGWRTLRPGAPARAQYASAGAALGLTLLFAATTPMVLTRVPTPTGPLVAAPTSPAVKAARPTATATPSLAPSEIAGVSANTVAGWAAVVWMVGAFLLALKLTGGWLFAWRVRSRAVSVTSASALASVALVRTQLRVTVPIELLQSPEVEAPVVMGWRRPAVILPHDLADQLSPEMIEPLLVHECAHIKRHDYVANLLQAFADLLLFFSPAAVWISKRIRETREYCCDDFAVFTCGDPKAYVKALTTLAALGTQHRARPALGVAGPRLIVRVRRLLKEESMSKLSVTRVAFVIAALLVLTITGTKISAVSVAHASTAAHSMFGGFQNSIPFGYATEQPGSGAELTRVVSSSDHPAELATVRNKATEAISGIVFAAVVEFFTSKLVPVSIGPGQTADVVPNVLSAQQLQDVAPREGGRVQLFFGLARILYANGFEWSVTPNPAATSGTDALNITRPDLPRSLVVAVGTQSQASGSACYDEQGKTYSLGAVIGIRREPGHFARCVNGQWIEIVAPQTFVVLELTLPGGAHPQLTIGEGTVGTVRLPNVGTFGFVPALANGNANNVTIGIFDLDKTPHQKLGTVEVSVGGSEVQSDTNPQFGIRAVRIFWQ